MQPTDADRALAELIAIERELHELALVRRSDALEAVSDAGRGLGDRAEGLLERAAAALGTASELDRVLISEVSEGGMAPVAIWDSDADARARAEATLARLRDEPIALQYPLVEEEVARRRVPQVVSVPGAGARTPALLARELGWESYAVAPLTAGGETIGLLHGDATRRGRAAEPLDAELLGRFAEELSWALERAVLRHTLDLHREELATAVQWLGGRLSRLEDAGAGEHAQGPDTADREAIDTLTRRELDVLHLLARGRTNGAIALELMVREGTIKYHVKNILRKLGATSRADAVARYVRAVNGPAGR
ncbi:MAG TPA: LuxR C-terminal-related transcriptional regulator [Solirubrobacteraceae bacterium]|nr:LuxR C-terminal-related transcriptional regulator [Solirubrobacteraceae bacterium]